MGKKHTRIGTCCICRRRDDGVGYMPKNATHHNKPPAITWACMDHIYLAERAAKMPRHTLDAFENRAIESAMANAADRLEAMGTSDLFAMDETQAHTFFKAFMDDFAASLEKQLAEMEPPF